MTRFLVEPVTLREANRYVAQHHRHHKPVRGCRFAIGLLCASIRVGVVIVGRPVARAVDQVHTAEVTRLCTDGTAHACSALYGAAARAARELGYRKIQTYILASEPGTSLKASGWTRVAEVRGRAWDHSSEKQLRLDGGTRRADQPTTAKVRWERAL